MARHRNRSVFSSAPSTGIGTRLLQILLLLIIVVGVAGSLFLGFGDFRPDPQVSEKPVTLQPQ